MMEPSHGYGLTGLLVGGGYFWLSAAVLAIVGLYLWRRSARVNDKSDGKGAVGQPRCG